MTSIGAALETGDVAVIVVTVAVVSTPVIVMAMALPEVIGDVTVVVGPAAAGDPAAPFCCLDTSL